MKLLIMYHSGVGNTKLIAEIIKFKLEEKNNVEMYAIEDISDELSIEDYDGLIIGFPTYHGHPSKSILNFMQKIKPLHKSKPAFIFTTCGWFSANTLRIFAKLCVKKKIDPVWHQSFRCIATDGVLLAPFLKCLFFFEKGVIKKIDNVVKCIDNGLKNKREVKLPRFRLMSIFNYPNKKIGQLTTFNIYINKEKCSNCGKCIKACTLKAMGNSNMIPMFRFNLCFLYWNFYFFPLEVF